MKKVLSIAGSDCSGGAGVQADLKTFSAHGVYGMSVIVSVVAENTSRVLGISDVAPGMIGAQIDAVFEDIGADAVKIGMLPGGDSMLAVAEKLRYYRPANVVIDPVMYAKNGCALMEPAAVGTLIETVVPLADVLTPNIPEAEKITGRRICSVADMEDAARRICAMGCKAVVVKGGHSAENALDVLFDGERIHHFDAERIHTKNTHGTGCTLSAAIAAQLARGLALRDAVAAAKNYVTAAIAHSLDIGKGCGPTHHFYQLYQYGLREETAKRPDYSLYLVTDRLHMSAGTLPDAVEQAILGGCTMVQLREKEMSAASFYALALEVKEVTDRCGVPLIINDRLDIALAVGAAGVHIGQADIPVDAARKSMGSGMLLGVSVHSVQEAERAARSGADYLGVGAMSATRTKPDAELVSMEELARIRRAVDIPIVAIGGICRENAGLFGAMGIDGLAAVSSILARPDIRRAAADLKAAFLRSRRAFTSTPRS